MKEIEIKKLKDVKLSKPIVIEGLPGIGSVGKIAVDFLVDSLEAKKIYDIQSQYFPHCVFVNEKGTFQLPSISLYHKKLGKKDFVFIAGDVQPSNEEACYKLASEILSLVSTSKPKELITLGGMALEDVPQEPQVYMSASSPKLLTEHKKLKIKHCGGRVGPIMGMSGVLAGLAKEGRIPSSVFLVETFNHPTYIGIKEARTLLNLLNKKFKFKVNMKELDQEITLIEKEIRSKLEKIMMSHQEDQYPESINYMG